MADMPQWAKKVEAVMDAVVSQATNDLLFDIDVSPGIVRTGSRKHGDIPRDLGGLAGSLQSTLYGSSSMSGVGENSYELIVGSMKGGDRAQFVWGGANAPYARRVHYGFSGTDSAGRTYNETGTFWVDVAVAGWQGYVTGAVLKVKAGLM